MMKKWVALLLLSLVLVGCSQNSNNDETEISQTSSSEEASQSTTKQSSTTETSEQSSTTSEETNQNGSGDTTLSKEMFYQTGVLQNINQQFLNWASDRAKVGGMAVTSEFFDHGAAGRGDWFAVTPDGLAMAQDLENPGYDFFPLHVVGGVTFYYSINGTLGATNERQQSSFAAGFSEVADTTKPIVKYILCDNGMIYELKSDVSLSTGFNEASDEGTIPRSQINVKEFSYSEDTDAISELQRILSIVNK